jgi:hypothetical protein
MIRKLKVSDREPTVLMTMDVVGGVWSSAVGLCRSLPETRSYWPQWRRVRVKHKVTRSGVSKTKTLVENDYYL